MLSPLYHLSDRVPGASGVRMALVGALSDFDEGRWPEVRSYAERIDRYVLSLNGDAKKQIVFDDPFVIADMIKKAKAGGTIGDMSLPLLEKYLEAAMKRVKERGGEKQAKRDLEWAARWSPFFAEWNAWNESVHSFSPGVPPSDAWGKQQNFEMRLRELEAAFLELGGTHVTNPIPETLETTTGKEADKPLEIPWRPIFYVGGALAGALLVSSVTGVFR